MITLRGLCIICSLATGLMAIASVTDITIAKGATLVGARSFLGFSQCPASPSTHVYALPVGSNRSLFDRKAVQIDDIHSLGDGFYRFQIHAAASAKSGLYHFAFLEADPATPERPFYFVPGKLAIEVKTITVCAVSFLYGREADSLAGSLPVYDPVTNTQYGVQTLLDATSGWDWYDGNYSWPVRYVKGMRDRYLQVMLHGPANRDMLIGASGGFGSGVSPTRVYFNRDGVAYGNLPLADNPISSAVGVKELALYWHAWQDGARIDLNTTTHRVYITGGLPSPEKTVGLPYWQVLEIGARAGGTLDGIRRQFNKHLQVSLTPNRHGPASSVIELRYYGSISGPQFDPHSHRKVFYEPDLPMTDACHHNGTTRMLLREGDGHCGAFARLEYDVLQYQGIDADLVQIAFQGGGDNYFRLKQRTAQGRYGGRDMPPSDFSDHCVVQVAGIAEYEDPSYGCWYTPYDAQSTPLQAFVSCAVESAVRTPYPRVSSCTSQDFRAVSIPYGSEINY